MELFPDLMVSKDSIHETTELQRCDVLGMRGRFQPISAFRPEYRLHVPVYRRQCYGQDNINTCISITIVERNGSGVDIRTIVERNGSGVDIRTIYYENQDSNPVLLC